jgi:hypothetical protein
MQETVAGGETTVQLRDLGWRPRRDKVNNRWYYIHPSGRRTVLFKRIDDAQAAARRIQEAIETEGPAPDCEETDEVENVASLPPVPDDLASAGWMIEVAEEALVPGSVRCRHAGLKIGTSIFSDPEMAFAAARRLQAREGKHKPARVEVEEETPVAAPEAIEDDVPPSPARDAAFWRETARETYERAETMRPDRATTYRRVGLACTRIADAIEAGTLAPELHGLRERADVMRLLGSEHFPDPELEGYTYDQFVEAGIDTPEKYAVARVALVALADAPAQVDETTESEAQSAGESATVEDGADLFSGQEALAAELRQWLDEQGIAYEQDAFRGEAIIDVATEKALVLVRESVSTQSIFNEADALKAARAASFDKSPESPPSHMILVCRAVAGGEERLSGIAQSQGIYLAVWPSGEQCPLQVSLLAPTLGETIISRLRDDVQTLPEFQAVVKNYRLDEIMAGGADPERFTLAEVIEIQEALGERARALGMTPATDETDEAAAAAEEMFFGEPETEASSSEPEPAGTPATVEPTPVTAPAPAPAASLFAEHTTPVLRQQMHPGLISTHPSLLMRAGGLDRVHVEDLRAVLRAGGAFRDPAEVYFDGERYWLAEGNHRREACLLEAKPLDINLHKGTLRDAILHAVRANAQHGLKRTDDDKRLAVVTVFCDSEWSRQSDTAISHLAEVSQPFVGKVQAALEKLLPLLAGAPAGTDEAVAQLAAESGAPAGLVRIVRRLSAEQREALAHNVMARAEERVSTDGRTYSVAPVEASPSLFEGEAFEDDTRRTATLDMLDPSGNLEVEALEEERAARDYDPVNEANADEAWREEQERRKAEQEAKGPESAEVEPAVVVNDRRRFADAAHEVRSDILTNRATPPPTATAAPQKPDRLAEIEKRLNGRSLVVTHTLLKGLGVQITVNLAGSEPSDALNSSLFPVKMMPLGDNEYELIVQRLDAEKDKAKTAAKGAKKSVATKKAATKAGSKKAAQKAPAKKAARAVAPKKPSATKNPERGPRKKNVKTANDRGR